MVGMIQTAFDTEQSLVGRQYMSALKKYCGKIREIREDQPTKSETEHTSLQ